MELPQRKLVIAPFGADSYGDDVLLFEHGLLFGLEMALESSSGRAGFSFADVHDQLGGGDKQSRLLPALTEGEVRTLAAKAGCDAFIDGMLMCVRDDETDALVEVAVALRVFHPNTGQFDTPDALVFNAFNPREPHPNPLLGKGDLSLDFEAYVGLQSAVCKEVFDALGAKLPLGITSHTTAQNWGTGGGEHPLQITRDWDAYVLFIKGKRAAKNPETKLGYYEQAVKKDPSFFLALYNSAMLYKTQTDYNTARTRLMKAAAVTQDPELLGDVYFELGLCSIYLGDPKTARNFWEKALEFGVDNPSLLVNMAGTYEQEENWEEAKRLNQLTLERFPDHHKAVVNLARLHAMFGRLDLAIPLYEQALELQPGDALRHAVLGGCYLADERFADARAQFERAVDLDPDGDPGKYAAQELAKLSPSVGNRPTPSPLLRGEESGPLANGRESEDEETKKRKRWGLF